MSLVQVRPAAAMKGRASHRAGSGGSSHAGLALSPEPELNDTGLGLLGELVADPTVSDVLVNGPEEIWVDRGAGLVRLPGLRFRDEEELRRFAVRLVGACGRRLDDSCPCVDVRLPDGTRLHAVLPPIAVRGPYVSLRTLRAQAMPLSALTSLGTLTPDSVALVEAVVSARLAFVISGGTGSGKTTLLSAMVASVPSSERVVIVEDATELAPQHPHVVSLQSRQSNVEGFGTVGLRELIRAAMRMRPDRLIVGECRGAEVVDLLGALNTGHEGGACTVHANSAADVPARFEALGLLGGVDRRALHAQLLAGVQVVLHLVRIGRTRCLQEVCVLRPSDDGVGVETAWHRDYGASPGADSLALLLAARSVRVPTVLNGQP